VRRLYSVAVARARERSAGEIVSSSAVAGEGELQSAAGLSRIVYRCCHSGLVDE